MWEVALRPEPACLRDRLTPTARGAPPHTFPPAYLSMPTACPTGGAAKAGRGEIGAFSCCTACGGGIVGRGVFLTPNLDVSPDCPLQRLVAGCVLWAQAASGAVWRVEGGGGAALPLGGAVLQS